MRTVIIECAYGGDRDRDARARLEQEEFAGIDTALAVAIPDWFRRLDDQEAKRRLKNSTCSLGYAALQRDGSRIVRFPAEGYCAGNVADLAAFARLSSASRQTIEQAADAAASHLTNAASILQGRLGEFDRRDIRELMRQGSDFNSLRTVALLWLDAMLVQSHLRNCDLHALRNVRNPDGSDLSVGQVRNAWNDVLEQNWRSIFQPAVKVLDLINRGRPDTARDALKQVAAARVVIDEARIGDGFSVGGELFPKVSADRKTAAAFYTTPATAEMLAGLTIRAGDSHDWCDPKLFRRLRVADLACGTGTLLRAAWRRIRMFGEAAGWTKEDIAVAHVAAMEGGIVATDVSPIAAHLSNSGMALAGGGNPYLQTSIGWIEAGRHSDRGRTTGSLEFLGGDTVMDSLDGMQAAGAVGGGGDVANQVVVPDASLNYIIMNPPYSRTRGGQRAFDIAGMTDEMRRQCQNRWKFLLRRGKHDANMKAGMAASFLCIAAKKASDGGRIGFVLPLTAAFAESWTKTRAMVCREFDNIIAVTLAGQRRAEAYSADTDMGEMLLVARRRRRTDNGDGAPIFCVTLNRTPLRQGEAGEFARSLLDCLSDMRGNTRSLPE